MRRGSDGNERYNPQLLHADRDESPTKKPVGHIALSYSAVDAPKIDGREDDTALRRVYA